MKSAQIRWGKCQYCGADGWWTPSTHIGLHPLYAHDRPDGRQCLKAERAYVHTKEAASKFVRAVRR